MSAAGVSKYLYSKMKIFHFPEKLMSLSPDNEQILPPIHVRIKPTNICNHSCSYCAYRAENLQLGKDMQVSSYIPRDKMLEIIDDMAEMKVKAITFSGGGEPLCYPYMYECLQKLSQTDIRFAALTNGELLSGEIAELFAHRGSWIRISIDGWDEDSYCSYRKVKPGTFFKIMQNIRNFRRMKGNCSLGASIIVNRSNYDHIIELAKTMKEAGVDSIKISPCIVSNSGKENNLYHKPIYDEVRNSIAHIIDVLEDDDLQIFDAYHSLEEKFEKNYKWCPYIQILTVIGADMNIYSCQDKAYNLIDGKIDSIKENHFKKVWYSNKKLFFKINPSLNCNHHCVANEKNKLICEYALVDNEHLEFV